MSTLKDKLRQTQQQGCSNAPKLDIINHLDVKVNEATGKISFHWFDRSKDEGERDQFSSKPITGILIGSALKITAFDQGLEAMWFTSMYFTNADSIVLFEPAANGPKKAMVGTPKQVDEYLGAKRLTVKRQCILFVLTFKGLVQIKTNLILSIGQLQAKVNGKQLRDQLSDYMIVLNPVEYDPADTQWSKDTKKYLGPFAEKNRPKYASISLGDEISEELLVQMKAEEVMDNYRAWKEYKTKNIVTQEDESEKAPATSDNEQPPASPSAQADKPWRKPTPQADFNGTSDGRAKHSPDLPGETDDIPF